jgi:hypothetical protein
MSATADTFGGPFVKPRAPIALVTRRQSLNRQFSVGGLLQPIENA